MRSMRHFAICFFLYLPALLSAADPLPTLKHPSPEKIKQIEESVNAIVAQHGQLTSSNRQRSKKALQEIAANPNTSNEEASVILDKLLDLAIRDGDFSEFESAIKDLQNRYTIPPTRRAQNTWEFIERNGRDDKNRKLAQDYYIECLYEQLCTDNDAPEAVQNAIERSIKHYRRNRYDLSDSPFDGVDSMAAILKRRLRDCEKAKQDLFENPHDIDAQISIGKWEAAAKDDWDAAIPHLRANA